MTVPAVPGTADPGKAEVAAEQQLAMPAPGYAVIDDQLTHPGVGAVVPVRDALPDIDVAAASPHALAGRRTFG